MSLPNERTDREGQMAKSLVEEIEKKRRKAIRYAKEPERFQVNGLSVIMQSEHGNRTITFSDGNWSCTCDFFAGTQTCSHTMGLSLILTELAGLRQTPSPGQG
jgi:hypothetical protein